MRRWYGWGLLSAAGWLAGVAPVQAWQDAPSIGSVFRVQRVTPLPNTLAPVGNQGYSTNAVIDGRGEPPFFFSDDPSFNPRGRGGPSYFKPRCSKAKECQRAGYPNTYRLEYGPYVLGTSSPYQYGGPFTTNPITSPAPTARPAVPAPPLPGDTTPAPSRMKKPPASRLEKIEPEPPAPDEPEPDARRLNRTRSR